jgi:hypothetical protein
MQQIFRDEFTTVLKLPAYMTEKLLEKGVKLNKQTNNLPLVTDQSILQNLDIANDLGYDYKQI